MDNFSIIYKILSVLEKSMDLEETDMQRISPENLKVSQERWNKYIEMLADAGYIKGVSLKRYADGGLVVNIDEIRITLKGLEYLSENTIMQRMYKAAKGFTDLIP
nr:YjcQ family protein [uncultured Schaedlerella sp.]